MSVLKRFSDIMSANINSLLDKYEDPAKMVDQIIRDLNDDLGKIKAETASVMAAQSRAEREVSDLNSQISKMMDYAKRAVAAGNDDDARKFLQKKVDLEQSLNVSTAKLSIAKENTDKMKAMYKKVTGQIEELNQKRSEIKAKMAAAKMQQKVNDLGSSLNGAEAGMSSFARMEEKANKILDEANAMAELNDVTEEDSVDDLMSKYSGGSSSAIDDELAALKGGNSSNKDDEIEKMLKDLK